MPDHGTAPAAVLPTSSPHATDRQAILTLVGLWRAQAARLAVGGVLALLALACGLALVRSSGLRLAGCITGEIIVTTAFLQWVGAGRVALRYAERLGTHDAMFRALSDLRVWFFRSLANGAAAGLGFRRSGDMLSRLVSDIGALDGLYLRLVVPLACACVTFPVLLAFALQLDTGLAVVIGVLFACGAFVIPWRIARSGRSAAGQMATQLAHLRVSVLDLIGGLREIRAFGAEKRMLASVRASDAALLQSQMTLARRSAFAGAGAFLCGQAAIFVVLLAIAGIIFPAIPVLKGIGLLFLSVAAFESVSTLTRAGLQAGTMAAAAVRVVDIAGDDRRGHADNTLQAAPAGTEIRFSNVAFRWSDDRAWVFQDLNLDIPPGARVAILGPSGIGKSSLAAMLLRAADPQAGTITLGGENIAHIRPDSLRARMAWLSQATHLFDDTIRANLLLGRPDAAEADLWQALDDAAIGDVVRDLPEGLDTWLGEGGLRLSGGQGRRIALARTLLTQAPILILDEPATGLDAQTEQEFLETLNTVTTGRTVILITHRLTGVEKLDHVWWLAGGQAMMANA
ncbi:MAG: thiol reductant ABC exporter subunit CydC [Acetobacter sp.]